MRRDGAMGAGVGAALRRVEGGVCPRMEKGNRTCLVCLLMSCAGASCDRMVSIVCLGVCASRVSVAPSVIVRVALNAGGRGMPVVSGPRALCGDER